MPEFRDRCTVARDHYYQDISDFGLQSPPGHSTYKCRGCGKVINIPHGQAYATMEATGTLHDDGPEFPLWPGSNT